MNPTYLTPRPFLVLDAKPSIMQADLGLISANPWLVVTDSNNPELFAQSFSHAVEWRNVVGDPTVFAQGSLTLPGLNNLGNATLHHGDWIQIRNQFYQFVADAGDIYPNCLAVILDNDSTPEQVQAAFAGVVNANTNSGVSVTPLAAGLVQIYSTVQDADSNSAITAHTLNALDLQIQGMSGAPLEVAEAPVLTCLGFDAQGLTGFTVDHITALQAPLVFALPPMGYIKQITGTDPEATPWLLYTVDHGVTWATLENIKPLWSAPQVPGNPLLGSGGSAESDIAGVQAKDALTFNDTTAGKWLGPAGDLPGNVGSNETGRLPGLDQ